MTHAFPLTSTKRWGEVYSSATLPLQLVSSNASPADESQTEAKRRIEVLLGHFLGRVSLSSGASIKTPVAVQLPRTTGSRTLNNGF